MSGKMSTVEKMVEILALALMLLAVVVKCLTGVNDTGALVILTFMGIMVFVIFLVCAFFPADWRMTDEQREKIKDLDAYQSKYRKVFVGINVVFSVLISVLLFTVVK